MFDILFWLFILAYPFIGLLSAVGFFLADIYISMYCPWRGWSTYFVFNDIIFYIFFAGICWPVVLAGRPFLYFSKWWDHHCSGAIQGKLVLLFERYFGKSKY